VSMLWRKLKSTDSSHVLAISPHCSVERNGVVSFRLSPPSVPSLPTNECTLGIFLVACCHLFAGDAVEQKGIPDFWLRIFKNMELLSPMIRVCAVCWYSVYRIGLWQMFGFCAVCVPNCIRNKKAFLRHTAESAHNTKYDTVLLIH